MNLHFRMLSVLIGCALHGETRDVTLREAVDLALRQNPDLMQARIEEQKAAYAVRIAKDPFLPKVYVGSGLAYSNGFPMSIEGSAPSIFQSRAVASVFNRSLSYRIAQANEEARGGAIDTRIRREEAVLTAATLFVDAIRWARTAGSIRGQIDGLRRSEEVVRARVKEGRELEIEARRAALAVAKTEHRLNLILREIDQAEGTLGAVLGFPAASRIHAVMADALTLPGPESEEAAVRQALETSLEVKKLESAILAKRHELREYQSARLPHVDVVAQYGLFARFNHYEDFFKTFQRHNGQIGLSLSVPIVPSSASIAQSGQAEVEINGLRTRQNQVRNRIELQTRGAYAYVGLMERGREIARGDLELAREQVNVTLAQFDEGRATLRQLEEARFQEQEKWMGYHDSQFALDKAKLDLLKQTGSLISALQ